MTAIYGDTLLSSPELMQTIQVFNQEPLVGGGYGPKSEPIPFRVLFMDKGSSVKDQQGNWVKVASRLVWCRKQIPEASFFYDLGLIWRFVTDQAWKRQGGFFVYGIEKVGGDNGKVSEAPAANLGNRDF